MYGVTDSDECKHTWIAADNLGEELWLEVGKDAFYHQERILEAAVSEEEPDEGYDVEGDDDAQNGFETTSLLFLFLYAEDAFYDET